LSCKKHGISILFERDEEPRVKRGYSRAEQVEKHGISILFEHDEEPRVKRGYSRAEQAEKHGISILFNSFIVTNN